MTSLLDAALAYAARGWHVLPLHNVVFPNGQAACTCKKAAACESPGKHPRIASGKAHGNASVDAARLRAWWRKWPQANVGIVTGAKSHLAVVDADGARGLAKLEELAREHGRLPPTLLARSGRADGGLHAYYLADSSPTNSGDGLDIRGDGGLVVAPPSMHASGRAYEWLEERAPAPMPDWLNGWFAQRGGSARRAPRVESKASGAISRPAWLAGRPVPGVLARASLPDLAALGDVAAALALIPNADRGWDDWNRIGLACWRACGGDPAGLAPFARWSAKSPKYDEDRTRERWEHYAASPPDAISFGTLVFEARKVRADWEPPSRAVVALASPFVEDDTENASRNYSNKRNALFAAEARNAVGAPMAPSAESQAPWLALAPEAQKASKTNGHAFLPQELTEETFGNPLIKLNEKYAVIGDVGGKCLVLSWIPSKVDETIKVPSFQTFKSFSERYANQYITVKSEKASGEIVEEPKQLGGHWLKWPRRRSYEGIDLDPATAGDLPGGVLNLWSGFAVEPVAGSWERMKWHICHILAGGDGAAAEYILKFAAWSVQHPGARAEVALVFKGGKGSGKGTFANALKRIFGQHGLQIFNSKHLVGAFNGHLRNCLLLFADEAFWAGDKQGESVLKGMLTEPALMIEQKGVDASPWRNRLKVIMAANAEWVVPASHDERRYAMFEVSDSKIGDRAYFDALHDELAGGGLAAMLHDLLAVKLGKWHPREIVRNAALLEQKQRSLAPLQEWYAEILEAGRLPGAAKNSPQQTTAGHLLLDAQSRIPALGKLTAGALGRFLKREGNFQNHSREGNFWGFPSLNVARKRWSDKFGGWTWPNDFSQWG